MKRIKSKAQKTFQFKFKNVQKCIPKLDGIHYQESKEVNDDSILWHDELGYSEQISHWKYIEFISMIMSTSNLFVNI